MLANSNGQIQIYGLQKLTVLHKTLFLQQTTLLDFYLPNFNQNSSQVSHRLFIESKNKLQVTWGCLPISASF